MTTLNIYVPSWRIARENGDFSVGVLTLPGAKADDRLDPARFYPWNWVTSGSRMNLAICKWKDGVWSCNVTKEAVHEQQPDEVKIAHDRMPDPKEPPTSAPDEIREEDGGATANPSAVAVADLTSLPAPLPHRMGVAHVFVATADELSETPTIVVPLITLAPSGQLKGEPLTPTTLLAALAATETSGTADVSVTLDLGDAKVTFHCPWLGPPVEPFELLPSTVSRRPHLHEPPPDVPPQQGAAELPPKPAPIVPQALGLAPVATIGDWDDLQGILYFLRREADGQTDATTFRCLHFGKHPRLEVQTLAVPHLVNGTHFDTNIAAIPPTGAQPQDPATEYRGRPVAVDQGALQTDDRDPGVLPQQQYVYDVDAPPVPALAFGYAYTAVATTPLQCGLLPSAICADDDPTRIDLTKMNTVAEQLNAAPGPFVRQDVLGAPVVLLRAAGSSADLDPAALVPADAVPLARDLPRVGLPLGIAVHLRPRVPGPYSAVAPLALTWLMIHGPGHDLTVALYDKVADADGVLPAPFAQARWSAKDTTFAALYLGNNAKGDLVLSPTDSGLTKPQELAEMVVRWEKATGAGAAPSSVCFSVPKDFARVGSPPEANTILGSVAAGSSRVLAVSALRWGLRAPPVDVDTWSWTATRRELSLGSVVESKPKANEARRLRGMVEGTYRGYLRENDDKLRSSIWLNDPAVDQIHVMAMPLFAPSNRSLLTTTLTIEEWNHVWAPGLQAAQRIPRHSRASADAEKDDFLWMSWQELFGKDTLPGGGEIWQISFTCIPHAHAAGAWGPTPPRSATWACVLETLPDLAPTAMKKPFALHTSTDNRDFESTLMGAPAADPNLSFQERFRAAYFRSATLDRQRWRWDGRPFQREQQRDLDALLNCPERPPASQGGIWFLDRSDRDAVSTTHALPPLANTTLRVETTAADQRGQIWRSRARAHSRYGACAGEQTTDLTRWQRRLVEAAPDQTVRVPAVRLVLPLTRNARADTRRKAAPLLVVLDEPWFENFGVVEQLEVEVARTKDGAEEIGPDPLHAGKPWGSPDPRPGPTTPPTRTPIEIVGPVGYTHDASASARRFVRASFIVALPDNAPAWSLVKLRFTRLVRAAQGGNRSAPSEAVWGQVLPDAGVFELMHDETARPTIVEELVLVDPPPKATGERNQVRLAHRSATETKLELPAPVHAGDRKLSSATFCLWTKVVGDAGNREHEELHAVNRSTTQKPVGEKFRLRLLEVEYLKTLPEEGEGFWRRLWALDGEGKPKVDEDANARIVRISPPIDARDSLASLPDSTAQPDSCQVP